MLGGSQHGGGHFVSIPPGRGCSTLGARINCLYNLRYSRCTLNSSKTSGSTFRICEAEKSTSLPTISLCCSHKSKSPCCSEIDFSFEPSRLRLCRCHFPLNKLRKSEGQYAKLRDLLRDVREELATRDQGGVVPNEDFERLWQKYDRAKAKVRC